MKYLIVSDNHGDQAILQTLLKTYKTQVDAFIHCGDSELNFKDPMVQEMTIVCGNMDFDAQFPESATLEVGTDRIFVAHGHLWGVNYGLDKLYQAGLKNQANLIFYGHTHQLACTMDQGRLLLNPGSISQPRGQYAYLRGTFAIVTTEAKKIVVDYYNRQLKPVPNLHFEFKK
ncbi:metallophosphoesterase family protein [Agrilactobacillus yilanensis]|uniref:Phosphoesterase n=1 Tax=Agrilactobacillus yilanensis TaxID=2485997 RepID=A0ABW4J5S9_9LACO|nr:metallophosphoesterase family protein [Agrilactobacillus yilanensis]